MFNLPIRLLSSLAFLILAFDIVTPRYKSISDASFYTPITVAPSVATVTLTPTVPPITPTTVSATPTPVVQKVLAATIAQTPVMVTPTQYDFSAIYSLENNFRANNGLATLTPNYKLASSALAKAYDMVRYNYFAHTSPEGVAWTSFVLSAGYRYSATGENLAIGLNSPNAAFNAWQNSPEHRANLLSTLFTDMGVAALCHVRIQGYSNVCIVVMHFGAK